MLSSLSKIARSRASTLSRNLLFPAQRVSDRTFVTDTHDVDREPLWNLDEFAKYREMKDEGPFIMVNLVKIKDRDSWDKYVEAFFSRFEADVVYAGTRERSDPVVIGSKDFNDWDLTILVRYKTAAAYFDIIDSDEYTLEVYPMRKAAVERAHLIMTRPFPDPEEE